MSRGRRHLRHHQADLLATAITNNPGARLTARRSAEGDPARMRGIPIQGARGVPGTMLGTRPDGWIDNLPDDT